MRLGKQHLGIVTFLFCYIQYVFAQISTSTEEPDEETFWSSATIQAMIFSALAGALILIIVIFHVLYHFSHDRIKVTGMTRYANLLAFIVAFLACLSYGILKTDYFLPVGKTIPCKIGYVVPFILQGSAKVVAFSLFTLRIYSTFSASSFAYSPKLLALFVALYVLLAIVAASVMLYFAIPIIELRHTEYPEHIGVCSIGELNFGFQVGLATSGLVDMIQSGILVYLFCSKLRQLVKMTSGVPTSPASNRGRVKSVDHTESHTGTHDSGNGNKTPEVGPGTAGYKLPKTTSLSKDQANNHAKPRASMIRRKRGDSKHKRHSSHDHNNRLKRIMYKQTLLFLISVISSVAFWVLGALKPEVSLFISVDTLINSLCIWFMFRFADDVWNRMIHCCDCFGCCGSVKDNLVYRMNTLSRSMRTMSLRNEFKVSVTDDDMQKTPQKGPVVSPSLKSVSENAQLEANEKDINMDRLGSGHEPIAPQMTDRDGNLTIDINHIQQESSKEVTPDTSMDPTLKNVENVNLGSYKHE